MTDLIDLYFRHVNVYSPLLHRPTFEKSVAEGLHLTDDAFGANLLLVCAVGARYSDDPRVLLDGVQSVHSSGWKWFDQVQLVKKSLLAPPTLYDIQFYCVRCEIPDLLYISNGILLALSAILARIVRTSSLLDDGWDRGAARPRCRSPPAKATKCQTRRQ